MVFCSFLGINTHDFAKNHPNLKITACFTQTFMELNMKKVFDPKTVTFGVWDLETSF